MAMFVAELVFLIVYIMVFGVAAFILTRWVDRLGDDHDGKDAS